MKNLLVNILCISLVTVFFNCVASIPQKSINQIVFQKVIDINLSKDDLYKFALNWVKINLSGIDKLVYKNSLQELEAGIKNRSIVNRIISSGYYEDPRLSNLKIGYLCKIDCQQNKVKFKFEDIHYLNEEGKIFSKIKTIDRTKLNRLMRQDTLKLFFNVLILDNLEIGLFITSWQAKFNVERGKASKFGNAANAK